MAIEKGDIIQCPNCKIDIAELLIKPIVGERLPVKDVKSLIEGITIKNGNRMVCHECGASYFQGKLYIKDKGWCGTC